MKNPICKKRASLAAAALFCAAAVAGENPPRQQLSYNAYVRAGSSTGIFKQDISDSDASFNGANIVFNGSAGSPDLVIAAQAKLKMTTADTYKEAGTSSSWEKAYLGFNLPVYKPLRLWGGHGLPLSLAGSYFSLLDIYAAGARWLKDGLALQYRGDTLSFGAGLVSTTTKYVFYEDFQAGSGLQLNFGTRGLPLQWGISAVYKSSNDGKSSVSERDWTAATFACYKPGKALALTAGYCINGSPVPINTTYGFVEYYSKSANSGSLSHCHVLTINSQWKAGPLTVEQEAEGARSFDDGYYSGYCTLRLKAPLGRAVTLAPSLQYFAVWKDGQAQMNRDCLVLYPRLYVTKGKHQFSLGGKFEHREMTADCYHWIFKLPAYYRYTL